MHQPMLNGDVQQQARRKFLLPDELRIGKERSFEPSIEAFPKSTGVVSYFRQRRPIRGLVRRQSSPHRINTKGE